MYLTIHVFVKFHKYVNLFVSPQTLIFYEQFWFLSVYQCTCWSLAMLSLRDGVVELVELVSSSAFKIISSNTVKKEKKRSDNIIYLYIASFSSLNKGNNLIFLNKSTKNNLKIIKHEFHQLPLSDNIMLEHSLSPLWLENISHKSWLFSKHHLNFLPPASNEIKTCKSHGYKNSIEEK